MLLDLNMPKRSGHEILAHLQKKVNAAQRPRLS